MARLRPNPRPPREKHPANTRPARRPPLAAVAAATAGVTAVPPSLHPAPPMPPTLITPPSVAPDSASSSRLSSTKSDIASLIIPSSSPATFPPTLATPGLAASDRRATDDVALEGDDETLSAAPEEPFVDTPSMDSSYQWARRANSNRVFAILEGMPLFLPRSSDTAEPPQGGTAARIHHFARDAWSGAWSMAQHRRAGCRCSLIVARPHNGWMT